MINKMNGIKVKLLTTCAFLGAVLSAYATCYKGQNGTCPTYTSASSDCGTGMWSTYAITVTSTDTVVKCVPWTAGSGDKYRLYPQTCNFFGNYVNVCGAGPLPGSWTSPYFDCNPLVNPWNDCVN